MRVPPSIAPVSLQDVPSRPGPSHPAATVNDIRRMATQIALAYARGRDQASQAFPDIFRTAYRSLTSCAMPTAAAQRQEKGTKRR